MTLQKAQNRGKLEEASTALHRELHIMSKLLTRFVLNRIYQMSIIIEIVSKIF